LLTLADLLAESRKAGADRFLALVSSVDETLQREQRNGRCGEAIVEGRLVHIDSTSRLVVVGDIHGDLDSLSHILADARLPMSFAENTRILFLGDYVDRGQESIQVLHVVLRLKEVSPTSVILLRGNHEGPSDLSVSPHDLPHDLAKLFGAKGDSIYRDLRGLFDHLYVSAILDQKYLFVHGGIPSTITFAKQVADAQQNHPLRTDLEEMLWSDPVEVPEGTAQSPRGAGRLFGKDVTRRVLSLLHVRTLIRGHTPVEDGVAVSHDGLILTLFSRKGAPYFNSTAAYLALNCAAPALDANSLAINARRF